MGINNGSAHWEIWRAEKRGNCGINSSAGCSGLSKVGTVSIADIIYLPMRIDDTCYLPLFKRR
jgi:hypothetical protein